MSKRKTQPAERVVSRYIDQVLSGKIPAASWVKKACQRHIDDLRTASARGLYFDPDAAQFVIDFFSILKHSKGRWAGQQFKLEPWQQFILCVLFGWMRQDGARRFRSSYIEVARKNGKSTLAAGIGLYLLVADGEPGAEIYSVATKMDQAKIIHQEAINMVSQIPIAEKAMWHLCNNIHVARTQSKF